MGRNTDDGKQKLSTSTLGMGGGLQEHLGGFIA